MALFLIEDNDLAHTNILLNGSYLKKIMNSLKRYRALLRLFIICPYYPNFNHMKSEFGGVQFLFELIQFTGRRCCQKPSVLFERS